MSGIVYLGAFTLLALPHPCARLHTNTRILEEELLPVCDHHTGPVPPSVGFAKVDSFLLVVVAQFFDRLPELNHNYGPIDIPHLFGMPCYCSGV
jgi:hypothetical protein